MKHAELRALIGRAPVIKRDTSGRVRWTPSLKSAVRELIAAGCRQEDMAHMLGISGTRLREGIARHDLCALPADHLTVTEIADRWRITEKGTLDALRAKGVPLRWWSGQYIIPTRDIDALTATRATMHTTRPRGYVTADELATRWGMARSSVHKRLKGTPYVLLKQDAGQPLKLFDARDVDRMVPVGTPHSCPRGYLPVKDMADLVVRTRACVRWWIDQGCPSIQGKGKVRYLNPAHVAAWLEGRPDPRTRKAGVRLRGLLERWEAA